MPGTPMLRATGREPDDSHDASKMALPAPSRVLTTDRWPPSPRVNWGLDPDVGSGNQLHAGVKVVRPRLRLRALHLDPDQPNPRGHSGRLTDQPAVVRRQPDPTRATHPGALFSAVLEADRREFAPMRVNTAFSRFLRLEGLRVRHVAFRSTTVELVPSDVRKMDLLLHPLVA